MAASVTANADIKEPLLDKLEEGKLTSEGSSTSKNTSATEEEALKARTLVNNAHTTAPQSHHSTIVESRLLEFVPDDNVSFSPALRALFVYLGLGFLVFWLLNDETTGVHTNSLVDALYFTVVTLTTVGYGDMAPSGVIAKIFTCLFVFSGFFVVDALITTAADYLEDRKLKTTEGNGNPSTPGGENSAVNSRNNLNTLLNLLPFVNFFTTRKDYGSDMESRVKEAWEMVYVCSVQVAWIIIIGVSVLHFVEGLSWIDAFYCACVTVTTVGYGDSSFSTIHGRIFAIFWILGSTVIVAHFFLALSEARMTEKQKVFVSDALKKSINKDDLKAMDLNKDGNVSAAEFVLIKLIELGKVETDDISLLLEKFKREDADKDGHLDDDDLKH